MGRILTAGGRIKWGRVWIYVSPFVFLNMVVWYWTFFMLPTNQYVTQMMREQDTQISTLRNENTQLKARHRALVIVARDKISYVRGQKAEMDRLLAHWHDRAVTLEMEDAGLSTDKTGMVGGWIPGTFSHLPEFEPYDLSEPETPTTDGETPPIEPETPTEPQEGSETSIDTTNKTSSLWYN